MHVLAFWSKCKLLGGQRGLFDPGIICKCSNFVLSATRTVCTQRVLDMICNLQLFGVSTPMKTKASMFRSTFTLISRPSNNNLSKLKMSHRGTPTNPTSVPLFVNTPLFVQTHIIFGSIIHFIHKSSCVFVIQSFC